MDITKLTLKQRQLIFFGLILPVCLGILVYSIYNIVYLKPEYSMNCAGKEFKTDNRTKLDIQIDFCNEHVMPNINNKRNNIDMHYLFNESNITL